jgi:hypothetical protein
MNEDELDNSVEGLILQLFRLQDLNGNGFLEEEELVQLNKKLAMLHTGKDVDKEAVKEKFQRLFRRSLDANGEPVPVQTFSTHIREVLNAIDTNEQAQEFILEQWVLEAELARHSFRQPSMNSLADLPFLLLMPKDEGSRTWCGQSASSRAQYEEQRGRGLQGGDWHRWERGSKRGGRAVSRDHGGQPGLSRQGLLLRLNRRRFPGGNESK